MSLRCNWKNLVSWDYRDGNALPAKFVSTLAQSVSLTDGTGANQANKLYVLSTTLAPSGSTTLTLASLLDAFGTNFAFARIKRIVVKMRSTPTAASVLIGAAGTSPWLAMFSGTTPALRILNGGDFALGCSAASGYAVSGGSGDQLKFTNEDASNAAAIDVVLIGTNA